MVTLREKEYEGGPRSGPRMGRSTTGGACQAIPCCVRSNHMKLWYLVIFELQK